MRRSSIYGKGRFATRTPIRCCDSAWNRSLRWTGFGSRCSTANSARSWVNRTQRSYHNDQKRQLIIRRHFVQNRWVKATAKAYIFEAGCDLSLRRPGFSASSRSSFRHKTRSIPRSASPARCAARPSSSAAPQRDAGCPDSSTEGSNTRLRVAARHASKWKGLRKATRMASRTHCRWISSAMERSMRQCSSLS